MRIAVTGASGFVARHLIPLLLTAGHDVHGLARNSPEDTGAAGTAPGFTFASGDVRLHPDAERLADGCQLLVHLAASFSPEDAVAGINERGTRTVLSAARAAGVGRLVFLSCLGAEAGSKSAFHESKWRAEQMVRASGIPFTIVRPSLVVGNGDGVVRPLAELVRALPITALPADPEARLQPIDVDDLCRCILALMADDAHLGETISLGGPMFLTLRQLTGLIAAEIGRSAPGVRLPARLHAALAPFLPPDARPIFAEARREQFEHGVVTSPGIVKSTFGFEPASIYLNIARYLA